MRGQRDGFGGMPAAYMTKAFLSREIKIGAR